MCLKLGPPSLKVRLCSHVSELGGSVFHVPECWEAVSHVPGRRGAAGSHPPCAPGCKTRMTKLNLDAVLIRTRQFLSPSVTLCQLRGVEWSWGWNQLVLAEPSRLTQTLLGAFREQEGPSGPLTVPVTGPLGRFRPHPPLGWSPGLFVALI